MITLEQIAVRMPSQDGDLRQKDIGGVMVPESDGDTVAMANKALVKKAVALRKPKRAWLALDIGSHVGLWSQALAEHYSCVVAFEPMPAPAKCAELNLADIQNASVSRFAISDADRPVAMEVDKTNSASGFVSGAGTANYAARSIDSLGNNPVDFIRMDVAGHEAEVLSGGIVSIQRDRPVILIHKSGSVSKATATLKKWGYELTEETGDYALLSHPDMKPGRF